MPLHHRYLSALAGLWVLPLPCAAQSAAPDMAKTTTVPAITSFTPSAGPLGTHITITGTGFTGATGVTVGGTSSTFTVKSATQINDTVPATASGPLAVTTPGGTATSTVIFTVTPSLTLSTAKGHEGQSFSVTAAGFAPYNAIDVYFDTTDVALAVSNNLGVVSIPIQVPANAQPGTHWVTLDSRATHIAAQGQFTVNTDWVMQGFNFDGRGLNPYENTLNTSNVGGLTTAWMSPSGGFGNASPFIEVGGNIYIGDVLGSIFAYSSTGSLLWSAAPAGADFQSITPASYGNLVYFASGSSVYAYPLGCHSNGAACTPSWTATIGANVAASLSVANATLYAPGSDGNIYPINPNTGVVGTAFAAYGTNTAATSAVAFDLGGGYYYAESSNLAYRSALGSSGHVAYAAGLSAPVISQGHVFFTTADGMAHLFGGWSAATSGSGCAPQPAVANNLVFAGGCSSIGAYEAGQGTLYWSVTVPGQVLGLSVANGVLYGCVVNNYEGQLFAYDASYGGLLWSGGGCTGAPVVANGTVYGALADISAYALAGSNSNLASRKPAPSRLTPNLRLKPQATPDNVSAC